MTTAALVTADELLQMKDDGFRYELVRGELRKKSPAGHRHGRIALNLTWPLFLHVKRYDLGSGYAAGTGFELAADPDLVRAPDAAFIRAERVEAVGETEGFWPGAPDLAAEVLSPGETSSEVKEKSPTGSTPAPPGRRGRSGISNGNPVPLAQGHPCPGHRRRTRRRRGGDGLGSSGSGYLPLISGLSLAARPLRGGHAHLAALFAPIILISSHQPCGCGFISASSLRRYSSLPSSSSLAHSSSDRKEGVPTCSARHWISACSSMARLR